MRAVLEAIAAGADAGALAGVPLPASYRALCVHRDEAGMFEGLPSCKRDPRQSLHLDEVPVLELAPDEALVAVMASSVNFKGCSASLPGKGSAWKTSSCASAWARAPSTRSG